MCGGSDDLERGAKSVEPAVGKLRGAGGELQKTCQFFLREARHHRPEPLHHLREGKKKSKQDQTSPPAAREEGKMRKASVTYLLSEVPRSANNHSVGLEVLYVYVTSATHQQLEAENPVSIRC